MERHGPAAAFHQQKGSSPWQIHARRRFNAVLRRSCLRTTDGKLMRGSRLLDIDLNQSRPASPFGEITIMFLTRWKVHKTEVDIDPILVASCGAICLIQALQYMIVQIRVLDQSGGKRGVAKQLRFLKTAVPLAGCHLSLSDPHQHVEFRPRLR